MALLRVEDMRTVFRTEDGVVQAVDGVSFEVRAGATVGIVGESGCGKSVSAMSVMRLIPDPPGRIEDGRVLWKGRDLLAVDPDEMPAIRGREIAMIFQDPMTSLNPVFTVRRQLGEVLEKRFGLQGEAAGARMAEMLQRVGIADAESRLDQYPHELSGGMKQRIMIAMALMCEPDLLIADEPTTALDVTVQARILELLRSQQRRLGMSILLITHDLTIVGRLADRVFVMTEGRIVEHGEAGPLMADPQHAYTRRLLASEPPPRESAGEAEGPPLVEASGVRVHFPIRTGVLRRTTGHVRAVEDVSLAVRPGRSVGVVGESGSGKTTLGLALLRLQACEGELRFDGRDLRTMPSARLRPLRRRMQIVFQDPFSSLSPRLTAFQIVEEGLLVHGIGATAAERRELVARVLGEVDLDPEAMDRYPHEFSGGQRQRLAIARAVVLEPRFLVLDEPTSALDRTVQLQILELLRRLQDERGLGYLLISHDLRVVRALAEELIVMKEGRVVEAGPARQLFEAPASDYTKALMAAAFEARALGRDEGD